MGNNNEREQLKKAYPSRRWWAKVDKMSDSQVVAVYMRLRLQGKV